MRQLGTCVTLFCAGIIAVGMLFSVSSRQEVRALADDSPRVPTFSSDPSPATRTAIRRPPTPVAPQGGSVRHSSPRAYILDEDAPAFQAPVQSSGAPNVDIPRVMLTLTPDHQIQVVASTTPVHGPLETSVFANNAILIIAQEFQIKPPPAPGNGKDFRLHNEIHCTGAIEIHSAQFTASGTKLSISDGELVLEGTAERPAVVTKAGIATTQVIPTVAPPAVAIPTEAKVPAPTPGIDFDAPQPAIPATIPAPAPEKPAAPEFRVSATKITFTLSLDRLQVGSGTVITPPGPVTPALDPQSIPNVPLPPRVPRDLAVPYKGEA